MSRENWWLDYVEGEVDAATKNEMKAMLRHSDRDQDLVKSLTDTKSLLKEHAEEIPDLSDDFFDRMHDQIMAQVENTDIKPAAKFRLKPNQKRIAKTASAGLVTMFVLVSTGHYLAHHKMETKWDIPQQMVQHAHENPDELAQMMAFQSEHDFLVDVASLSLDHLSKEQFESLLKTKHTKTR